MCTYSTKRRYIFWSLGTDGVDNSASNCCTGTENNRVPQPFQEVRPCSSSSALLLLLRLFKWLLLLLLVTHSVGGNKEL